MQERWLLIDDVRTYEVDQICRTAHEGKKALKENGPWHVLMLDNDLGIQFDPETNQEVKTEGWQVLEWAIENSCLPPRLQLVTSNSRARLRMILALEQEGYVQRIPGNNVDWVKKVVRAGCLDRK